MSGVRRIPRGVWIVVAVLAVIVYHDSIPSWAWTFAVGVLVVYAVFRVLSGRRRR
jgi:membrane protein implicated in regulation of membrane protease activity